jgi:hypothetical protein
MLMKESRKTLLVLLVLLFFTFLPTLSTVPFPSQDSPLVIKEVLTQTSVSNPWLTSAIHITTVAFLVALYWYGSKVGRVASAFFGILFIFIAFSNHIAVTQSYGLVVVTGNLVSILVVGLFWMWEVYRPRNVYVFQKLAAWRYWVLPFVFLAFWFPMSALEAGPDFNPLLLLTSSFGVMFCPTAPLVIALLTLISSSHATHLHLALRSIASDHSENSKLKREKNYCFTRHRGQKNALAKSTMNEMNIIRNKVSYACPIVVFQRKHWK